MISHPRCRFWITCTLIMTLGYCVLAQVFAYSIERDQLADRELDGLYRQNAHMYSKGFELYIMNQYLNEEIKRIKAEKPRLGPKGRPL